MVDIRHAGEEGIRTQGEQPANLALEATVQQGRATNVHAGGTRKGVYKSQADSSMAMAHVDARAMRGSKYAGTHTSS